MGISAIETNPISTLSSKLSGSLRISPDILRYAFIFVLTLCFSTASFAGTREQLKRMHDRLTGIAPTAEIMDLMLTTYTNTTGSVDAKLNAAALVAIDNNFNSSFYNVTLKNFATPWTNEAQTVFAPLNDYTATVIGLIRDSGDPVWGDFRKVLYENVVYHAPNGVASVNYAPDSNAHYEALENENIDLKTNLTRAIQALPAGGPAGIMTTRAAARAFFIDGTNRAMFRFTVLNHLCYDLEQIKDTTRPSDRIRQDVSRSPGGDSRIYMNNCIGCHAGMDPMTQALAYYEWDYKDADPMTEDDPDAGVLQYTPGVVQPKYHINDTNFKGGYRTPDNSWTNYWRRGANRWLGFSNTPPPNVTIVPDPVDPTKNISHGTDAASMGAELAYSDAFARCQVKKVFKTVCLRDPQTVTGDTDDGTKFNTMVANFKTGYNMKNVFTEAASYCSGD